MSERLMGIDPNAERKQRIKERELARLEVAPEPAPEPKKRSKNKQKPKPAPEPDNAAKPAQEE